MKTPGPTLTRRQLITLGTLTGASIYAAKTGWELWDEKGLRQRVFIGKAPDYQTDFRRLLLDGFRELGVSPTEIQGKQILLKPNLVEPDRNHPQINTHPLVVRGAAEAFLHLGARSVVVAEAAGHKRDSLLVLELSGLADVLRGDRIPFLDLNYQTGIAVPNVSRFTGLRHLYLPRVLQEADWVVSIAKLKTHHWAGVTLSMKNLFGTLPGIHYGWPKNVLHHRGIHQSILDLTATVRPDFCIIDGVVGMEGDGPILGTPVPSGVLVMGRNPPAVDATAARLMGIDPGKIEYLHKASGWLGPIHEQHIAQVGEPWRTLHRPFQLLDHIEAHRGLRLLPD